MIIDSRVGDVNGDMILDTVYLMGDKFAGDPYFKNIKLSIEDGRTHYRYDIPLPPAYNTGADPWIFLGSFACLKSEDIFVGLPLNNRSVYYLVSFLNNQPQFLLAPDMGPESYDVLSKELAFDVIYRDFYKVDVTSTKMNQTFTLDVSDRREEYEGVIYDKNGKLIKPFKGFVLYSPYLYPIQFNNDEPMRLMAVDDIAGMSHADTLGQLIYHFKYSAANKAWVMDPNQAQVMITGH
jgi:hypothetical protein